jgi:membrane-associated phospholipid phosphatase
LIKIEKFYRRVAIKSLKGVKRLLLLLTVPTLLSGETLQPIQYDYGIDNRYYFENPKPFEFLTALPSDFLTAVDDTFSTDNFEIFTVTLIGTGILIQYDRDIVNEANRFSEKIGLVEESESGRESREFWGLKLPNSLNSSLYFSGSALFQGAVASTFLGYGAIYGDPRSLQTASQIVEGYLLSGVFSQIIKRSTGRDYPYASEKPKGEWKLFPDQITYSEDIEHYGAFPSGYVATATSTVTIIAENYPEYQFVKPVGYTLLSLMMFGMLNSENHWISDYPVGVAIGYISAKSVLKRKRKREEDLYKYRPHFRINPLQFPGKGIGVALSYNY